MSEGARRRCPPEQTAARVLAHREALGITRVAVLTGLDVIGIPVVAAYRPNSRTVAVHQGKGATLAAARASALMEALECAHAERFEAVTRFATFAAMDGASLDPRTLPLSAGATDPRALRLPWVRGESLVSGRAIWVPHELVSADFTSPLYPGHGVFQASTNGLASGNHPDEAALHALCELIERDATALWRQAGERTRAGTRLDPASVDAPLSAALLRRFAVASVDVAIWDATSRIGVPAFLAMIEGGGGAWVEPELGAGCHPRADVALARALTEAAQARLTTISGARDDLPPDGFATSRRAARHDAAAAWRAGRPVRSWGDRPSLDAGSLAGEIALVLDALSRAGFGEAVRVDLTDPAIGIPVLRMIVPGLEGGADVEGYAPGPRALAAVA